MGTMVCLLKPRNFSTRIIALDGIESKHRKATEQVSLSAELNTGDNKKLRTDAHWSTGKNMSADLPAVIAVVGPMRSGTSCTAGILHKLGVSMGRSFPSANNHNPRGFYEAVYLRRLCWRCYKEPLMEELSTYEERVEMLRQWSTGRKDDGPLIGAKHPTLSMLVPEMMEAWPNLKIVATDRPVEDILKSLRRANWMRNVSDAGIRNVTETMYRKRDSDVAQLKVPTLRLPFIELLHDPAAAVDKIIAFASIKPTATQRVASIAHVEPTLNHHTRKRSNGT
jgi:hypothetical protein